MGMWGPANSLAFFLLSAFFLWRVAYPSDWQPASATIVHVDSRLYPDPRTEDAPAVTWFVRRVEFTTADGRRITAELPPRSSPLGQPGQSIAIGYNPTQPTEVLAAKMSGWWQFAFIAFLLGILNLAPIETQVERFDRACDWLFRLLGRKRSRRDRVDFGRKPDL